MRIACPSCNAVYQVPTEELGVGRVVRCVRCGTDWSPVVEVPVGEGAAAVKASERPMEELPEPPIEVPTVEKDAPVRRMALDEDGATTVVVAPMAVADVPAVPRRRGVAWLAIAWVVSLAVVGGGVAALVVGREKVMQVWPPSVRGYAAVGLAPRS